MSIGIMSKARFSYTVCLRIKLHFYHDFIESRIKRQVENSKSIEDAKSLIEKAGMKLTDDELEMVSGGFGGLVTDGCDDDELDDDVKIPKYSPRPSRL